jgi:stringent starvation protein B
MKNTFKPYMINAFYAWCMDYSFTPLVIVKKYELNVVPKNIEDNKINIFNIHPSAIKNLVFERNFMCFEAMFSGTPFDVTIFYESISYVQCDGTHYIVNFNDDFNNPFNNMIGEKFFNYKSMLKENPVDSGDGLNIKSGEIIKNQFRLIKTDKDLINKENEEDK